MKSEEMLACSIVKKGCIGIWRLRSLTVALHSVLRYLLHHIAFPMSGSGGHHEEQDARYSYVHLTGSNLQRENMETLSTGKPKVQSVFKLSFY